MSLLQVRRKIYRSRNLVRGIGKVRPIDQRIYALWESPMVIWEPQE